MSRGIDLGGLEDHSDHAVNPLGSAAQRDARNPVTLIWSLRGVEVRTKLLPIAAATFGRESTRDICLRVEPTSTNENHAKTTSISKLHFMVRYLGDRVELVDKHSANGTTLKSAGRLTPNVPTAIRDSDQIDVANALTLEVECCRRAGSAPPSQSLAASITRNVENTGWLNEQLVGPGKPGALEFMRVRRLNNMPEQEYVLLFGTGGIGPGDNALVRTGDLVPQKSSGRGLDIGAEATPFPAVVFFDSGKLCVKAVGNVPVAVNGRDLRESEVGRLKNGDSLALSGQQIRVSEP